MRFIPIALLSVLTVAACAQESHTPPVSSATRALSGGATEQEPQPSNSLPLGSAVSDPLTSRVGNIGTTRVGPAVPAGRTAY